MKHLAVIGGLMLIMARGKIQRDGEKVGLHVPRARLGVAVDRSNVRRGLKYE
jgi:hypothetical protein